MARRYRRRRKNPYSLSKFTRRIGLGFIYVGLVGAITGGVALLVNAIQGLVTFTIGSLQVDLAILVTIAAVVFDILLLVKAARYFGVRL